MLPRPRPPALPEAAYAAALASVRGLGARRLASLLDADPPSVAFERLVGGDASDLSAQCRQAATALDPAALYDTYRRLGISVTWKGRDPYPSALAADPEAPGVLFALGDPTLADRFPTVAVVGTRAATRYGLATAARLGADLTAAGVSVVTGLAPGVEVAAHEGAVAAFAAASDGAPPLAVVATALDRAAPVSHARLFHAIARAGSVCGETPLGAPMARWRFPQRDRILAALSAVVIVVECHAQGGPLGVVKAATRRGITVGAVPGSVRSPASAGSNDLLADGAFVVRDASDVLVAVGLARPGQVRVRSET